VPQLSRFFGFSSGFWEILVPCHMLSSGNSTRRARLGFLYERAEIGDRSIFAVNLDTVQGGFALE